MKIECMLKREGGTKVELDDSEYHFEPDANNFYVAEVENKSHIKTFLSIREAYREFGTKTKNTQEVANTPSIKSDIALKGSGWSPEIVTYGDNQTITTAELVKTAFIKSGITREAWNEQENEVIESAIEAELLTLEPELQSENTPAATLEEATDVQLATEQVTEAPKTKAEKKAALKARKLALGQR